MPPEKDDKSTAAIKKTTDAGGDDSSRRTSGSASAASGPTSGPASQNRTTPRESNNGADGALTASAPGRRRERYLIGMRTAPDGQPIASAQNFMASPQHSMDDVVQYLGQQENVEVIKRIKLGGPQPFTANGRSVAEVLVAKIDDSKAQRLRSIAPPHLIIEPDSPLNCADYLSTPTYNSAHSYSTPIGAFLPLRSFATDVAIRVIGERDQPLARAMVVVDAGELPAQALTDETGTARITFFGGSIDTVRTLFVRAPANHWDRLIPMPHLSSGMNTVRLRPLAELYPNFPSVRSVGWGQRLMGLDPAAGRLPDSPPGSLMGNLSGSAVRIGVIDSGCDNSHPLLRHVVHGKDFTPGNTDLSWTQDLVSHGTHCAGIINASVTEQGIVGCAPAAELHVFKVFPEGRISDLLAALDECIERELDLINISVVSDGFSELVNQKLQEARRKGIACIVAAGNSGGPLLFPAMVPAAMAVAAVGKLKEFPADSSHAFNVVPQLVGGDEIFAAAFSGMGPQIWVSAPGVAVISTVPGGGYAAADGTSAAAAHVTGLAAVVLAQHPLFQDGPLKVRSEQRVHALFELIRASAVPRVADPRRGGAGVPNLMRIPLPGAQSFGGSPSFGVGAQGFGLGLTIADATDRVAMPGAMPGYWPSSIQGQGWPRWLPTQTTGLF